ncbi:MAG: hypothetical protein HC835_00240 [Oscillatoriales cyanobacterium RM2_1_1]|nr:hypothetical protein [Oscillatoriales cyanobacterium SM2_3_0]NJO44179.1 hypothetical protein [Oscillatoriales cyanobacterium RM2_1_1]
MEAINLILIVGTALAAGFGFGYWLWERRGFRQRRAYEAKIRSQAEELERGHQSRIQETVQSLRQEYELQLQQKTRETTQFYEERLDSTSRSLRQEFTTERQDLTSQLATRELELEQASHTLSIYENRLIQVTEQLVVSEAKIQEMNQSLAQYEIDLGEVKQDVQVSKSRVVQLNQELGRYDSRIQELTETTAASQAELQERLGALEQQSTSQIQDIRSDLTAKSQAQIQGAVADLEQDYYQQIRQGTTQLVQFMQDPTAADANFSASDSNPMSEAIQAEVPELKATELKTTELKATEVETLKLETTELKAPEPETPNLETPEFKAFELKMPAQELSPTLPEFRTSPKELPKESIDGGFFPTGSQDSSASEPAPEPERVMPGVYERPESLYEPAVVQEFSAADPEVDPEIELLPSPSETTQTETPIILSFQAGIDSQVTQIIDKIAAWGNRGQAAAIPELIRYVHDSEDPVRAQVATALGQIATVQGSKVSQQLIPPLTNLSRDRNRQVRQQAVMALGRIQADEVISLLQQALRDSNPGVVQAASTALSRFKTHPAKPKPQSKNLTLQPPDSLKAKTGMREETR